MSACPCQNVHGLDEWFRYQVHHSPQATAVVEGHQSLTYSQLDGYVNRLAIQLSTWNIRYEEAICLLIPMGIQNIAAQIAIIRLGGSCVPMDVSFPDQRIHDLLRALGTRLAITTDLNKHRLASFQVMIVADTFSEDRHDNTTDAVLPKPVSSIGDHRTHVLHTSGTTGLPKPVEIMSKGITRMAFNKSCVEFQKTDRVAQIAAPSFDAALFEVWTTLVRGAAVVVLPKNVVIDPYALVENIQKYRISSILVTTALLNHVVSAIPSAFESLDYVLTGGEMANPKVLKAVLEGGAPKKLVHAYGPTECTIISTYHLVTLEELNRGLAPIGKPLDQTSCFILDDKLCPVKGDEIGELYIAGEGVARGYYCRPDANSKSFIELPALQRDDPSRLTRVYKTGDLCRYVGDGVMEFVTRADNMVKIRGFRIEPAEIESILLKSQMLQAAIVVPIKRSSKDIYIKAFVIPKDPEDLNSGKVDEYMKRMVPAYMLPRIEPVTDFPFTVHGKVDRRALVENHLRSMESAEKEVLSQGSDDTASWLKNLWMTILDVTKVENSSDFFSLGGSSLQAAAIIVHVRRRFGKYLSIQDIYNYPTLGALKELIDLGGEEVPQMRELPKDLLTDMKLACDLQVPSGDVPDWTSPDEGRIFLTGATGFLGTYMLRTFVDRDDVHQVRCLVRAQNVSSGRARLIEGLTKYGLGDAKNLHKIVAIPGDLRSPQFGLPTDEWDHQATTASVIFHVGAQVNYVQNYDKHRMANIFGTRTALALAVAGRKKAIHYTSTAAVSGPAAHFGGIERIYENESLQSFQQWLAHDIGYTQTKFVNEHLIQDMARKGLPTVIYRPGFIMGDTVTGMGNYDDFMGRVFLGCMKLGCRPSLPNQSKTLIPVDFCTNAIIHISSKSTNYGRTFHLTPQTPDQDVDLETVWEWLAECGYPLEKVSYRDWLEVLAKDSDLLSNPLLPMLPVLQEPVDAGRTRWELFENMARYDVTQTRQALSDLPHFRSGFECSDLLRHINGWKEQGLVSNIPIAAPLSSSFVNASLNFFSEKSEKMLMLGTLQPYKRPYDARLVEIEDFRGKEYELSLDRNGFEYRRHISAHVPPADGACVRTQLYPEAEEMLKSATGATRVHVFSHILRNASFDKIQELLDNKESKAEDRINFVVPARAVHIDQSENGAHAMLADNLPAEEAERLSKTRWAIINIWRPLKRVPKDPLAICDGRTVNESDMVELEAALPAPGGANYTTTRSSLNTTHIRFNKNQRWAFVSDMTPEECLLIKIYDTKRSVGARWAPHTAFEDPRTAHVKDTRQSLEMRCLVFFENEAL